LSLHHAPFRKLFGVAPRSGVIAGDFGASELFVTRRFGRASAFSHREIRPYVQAGL
jgi:hypothetical protein